MREISTRTVLVAVVLTIGGYYGAHAYHQKRAADLIRPVRVAALTIQGSLETGINYLDLSARIRDLGVAITIARDAEAPEEKLLKYDRVLACYKDSLVVWKGTVDIGVRSRPIKGKFSYADWDTATDEVIQKYAKLCPSCRMLNTSCCSDASMFKEIWGYADRLLAEE